MHTHIYILLRRGSIVVIRVPEALFNCISKSVLGQENASNLEIPCILAQLWFSLPKCLFRVTSSHGEERELLEK